MAIVVEHQEEVLEKFSLVGVDVSAKTWAVILEQEASGEPYSSLPMIVWVTSTPDD